VKQPNSNTKEVDHDVLLGQEGDLVEDVVGEGDVFVDLFRF
jgi:hypothetical protein